MKERLLTNIEPIDVLKYFEDLTFIPRESGNEEGVADYLIEFAKEHNLYSYRDKYNNVMIRKEASPGYEDHPGVIMQAHVDMVCEKNRGVEFDFATQPIEFCVEGDKIIAKNTSLGGDNGVGVALTLAALADENLNHPVIEGVFTTDEERGMLGIENFDFSILTGKYVINLDYNDSSSFCVGCAGGPTIKAILPVSREALDPNGKVFYDIYLRGLLGGHSGEDIHSGRGNANKLMARFLMDLHRNLEYDLVYINGGLKYNAIPRNAEATLAVKKEDAAKFEELLDKYAKLYKSEYRVNDPDVSLTCEIRKDEVLEKISEETKLRILDYVNLSECGVVRMDMDYPNLVESSISLGVIDLSEDYVYIWSLTRSSKKSQYEEMFNKVARLSELLGGSYEIMSNCPEWEYNPDSKLKEIVKNVYLEETGEEPEFIVVHAGLEVGEFIKNMEHEIDMIAMGPVCRNLHAPGEYFEINSTKQVWYMLKKVIENL